MDLKYIHDEELDILCEIDRICIKNNITYFLFASGTLLGAVRYQGFIPWDDDLDIAMFREDYEKFLKIAPLELSHPFFLCSQKTNEKYTNIFAKVFKTDSLYSSYTLKRTSDLSGVWVDIFPIDYIKANNLTHAKKKITNRMNKVMFLRILLENRTNVSNSLSKKMKFICKISRILPRKFYHTLILSLFTADSKKNVNFCTCYAGNRLKETFNLKDILPFKTAQFKNLELLIPNNSHHVLTSVFGDYTEIPPEKRRIPSHDLILNEEK